MSRVGVLLAALLVGALVIGAALVLLGYPGPVLLAVLLVVALVIAAALVRLGHSRPERAALVLAVVVVVVGLGATSVELAAGIADRQVDFRGELDVKDFSTPEEDEAAREMRKEGYAYLGSLEVEMTKPKAGTNDLVMWSIGKLAPWLLATIILVLVLPILRAARRGDPFWLDATRRLNAVGMLLLLGIPALAIVQFLTAHAIVDEVASDPFPSPKLTISIGQLLPGFLVLTLVGIFRRGVELQDLERHTV